MEEHFPDEGSYTIRVMFKDLVGDEKESVRETLSGINNVDSVEYDPDSADFNKDGYTLFVLNTRFDYDSDEEAEIEENVTSVFEDYDVTVRNNSLKSPEIPITVYLAAFGIILVILLISCGSYFEPLLFLINIAVAIVLNLGTNIFLGEISDITSGVAAILQLALSMDYSIILMNRYRQELEKTDDRGTAMSKALRSAFGSITGSAVTTIVGLLVLLFMRFKIGTDIGIVLAKGVAFSMLCVFTVLPALILVSHKAIEKTKKKGHGEDRESRSLSAIGRFEYRFRFLIATLFVLLITGAGFLQTQTTTVYTLRDRDPIADVFPSENTLVLLYKNEDEEAVRGILYDAESDSNVKSVSAYATTIGKEYTAHDMYDALSEILTSDTDAELTPDMLGIVYYDYHEKGRIYPMTLPEFVGFMEDKVLGDPVYASFIDGKTAESIRMLGKLADTTLMTPLSPESLAGALGMSVEQVTQLFMLRYMESYTPDKTMSLYEFVTFLTENVLTNSNYAAMLDENTVRTLMQTKNIADAVADETAFTPEEMSELLGGADEASLSTLFLYHASLTHSDPEWTLSLDALFSHLYDLTSDSRFDSLLTEELGAEITDAKDTIDEAIRKLRSDEYSRAVITSDYPDESAETTAFVKRLRDECGAKLSGEHYFIGNSEMVYELENGFDRELLTITLLTAVGLSGGSIYYLALLIVECILMGATIDYGIVFMSYYREARSAGRDVRDALIAAYRGSIHTVLTSGSIMVLVTMVVGPLFGNPAIEQIVKTLSVGALSAILLILFILPALIAVFDRLIRKMKD